jgi:hypothetical protein
MFGRDYSTWNTYLLFNHYRSVAGVASEEILRDLRSALIDRPLPEKFHFYCCATDEEQQMYVEFLLLRGNRTPKRRAGDAQPAN